MSLPILAADLGPGILAGFTTRRGGVSVGAWEGLDLGYHVGDDPDAVTRNRALLARWAGVPVRFGHQVHGHLALLVEAAEGGQAADGSPDWAANSTAAAADATVGDCDALVTGVRGAAVGVLVADCVPVLLADPQAGVVAAAHAGRNGLLAGVLQSALRVMAGAGARAERTRVAIGPAAGGCCYEVPAQMQEVACARLPALRATTRQGTPSLDLRAGCVSVLEQAAVASVELIGGCTIEDPSLYSYRRAAVTGRFSGVVRLLQ